MVHPALGAVGIANAPPVLGFGGDLHREPLALIEPLGLVGLGRPDMHVDLVGLQADEARHRQPAGGTRRLSRRGATQTAPAAAAKIITNRARLACLMRDANTSSEWNERNPGAFVLKRPSGRDRRTSRIRTAIGCGQCRRGRLTSTERAGKSQAAVEAEARDARRHGEDRKNLWSSSRGSCPTASKPACASCSTRGSISTTSR